MNELTKQLLDLRHTIIEQINHEIEGEDSVILETPLIYIDSLDHDGENNIVITEVFTDYVFVTDNLNYQANKSFDELGLELLVYVLNEVLISK